MKNRELFARDPVPATLPNNGVSKVAEFESDLQQQATLRYELETFVCKGEYALGLERILRSYIDCLGKGEQRAAWVSGFFGSGKSHLVKMLRYLWEDYKFPDGETARSIVQLPTDITDLLKELSTHGKSAGGLRAMAGTLGAGAMDNVRLAFVQLLLRAASLPENLAQARFVLWLTSSGLKSAVESALASKKRTLAKEVANLKVSTPLAEALLAADAKYGTVANAQEAIRAQFPDVPSPTINATLELVRQIFGKDGKLPCTLLVVDEVQQFVAEKIQRAMDVQEIAEACCTQLDRRLLLVGTGQSALNTTPSLQRLRARFSIPVQLSDSDVDSVIRNTVLLKKPEREQAIRKVIDSNQGEISRHLQNTRLAASQADESFYVPDYPLLPTRRRFWEKVLRVTDHSGTSAQLRTQMKIVFEAIRATGDRNVGTVVPADFIYDQISTDLLNTGELQKEYDEIIRKQRNETKEGELGSRICALIFLIGKLPKSAGADDLVRATPESIADLMISDLEKEGPKLRQDIPEILEQLVASGQVMKVENEYRLQTREGAKWTQEFSKRRAKVLNDDSRVNSRREELLRAALESTLKPVALRQGSSNTKRNLNAELSSSKPADIRDGVTLWIRDGWNEEEKTILNDARAATLNSPALFGFIPRLCHEDLRQAISAEVAAQETIDHHGPVTGEEAIDARKAVETQLDAATRRIRECLGQIIGASKVFLGGGQEAIGIELVDKVLDAGNQALIRLFPKFKEADHSNWSQVVIRAKAGDPAALDQVSYQGECEKHSVCRQVVDLIGPGKKGKDVVEYLIGAPFGWDRDAVLGALYSLMTVGRLRATLNGAAVQARDLAQNQVGVASFYVDVPPVSIEARLALKALFQKLGVQPKNGEESLAAVEFLSRMKALAESAGGDEPRPLVPSSALLTELQKLSGNAQLNSIHAKDAELTSLLAAWKKFAEGIAKRLPAWDRLVEFDGQASDLKQRPDWSESIAAIRAARSLLTEPDPVPPLLRKVTQALREELARRQKDLLAAYKAGQQVQAKSDAWQRLSPEQNEALTARFQLVTPANEDFSTDESMLLALRMRSLPERANHVDAVPQRFAHALEEAARLLEPKAVRVHLPSATLKTSADLEAWLADARKAVSDKLKDGPVIV